MTNAEIVNLLVQTKMERVREEIAALTAKMQQEWEVLGTQAEALQAAIAAEAERQVPEDLRTSVQTLVKYGHFSSCGAKKKDVVRLKCALDLRMEMLQDSRVYYGPADWSKMAKKFSVYWHAGAALLRTLGDGGYFYFEMRSTEPLKRQWEALYAAVRAYDALRTRRQELESIAQDASQVERKALALLTKRELSLDTELRERVSSVISDVLGDTKLLSAL